MDMIEQAKKIIAKGKLLNDPELVSMGLEMLEGYNEQQIQTNAIESKPAVETSKSNITDQFRVNHNGVLDKKYGKKVSIATEKRINTFVDDGSEFKSEQYKTPEVNPTPRRKPISELKVSQTCEICGKKENVLPEFAREYYRCEPCFLKGKV